MLLCDYFDQCWGKYQYLNLLHFTESYKCISSPPAFGQFCYFMGGDRSEPRKILRHNGILFHNHVGFVNLIHDLLSTSAIDAAKPFKFLWTEAWFWCRKLHQLSRPCYPHLQCRCHRKRLIDVYRPQHRQQSSRRLHQLNLRPPSQRRHLQKLVVTRKGLICPSKSTSALHLSFCCRVREETNTAVRSTMVPKNPSQGKFLIVAVLGLSLPQLT
jgi:hypothetical protein